MEKLAHSLLLKRRSLHTEVVLLCCLLHCFAGANDEEPPELPAVFVTKKVGEAEDSSKPMSVHPIGPWQALNERGIVLKGCEFKKKYMTEAGSSTSGTFAFEKVQRCQVMRSLGRLGGAGQIGSMMYEFFSGDVNACRRKLQYGWP